MPSLPRNEGLFSSPEKRNFVLALLLIVATLALYNSVTHHPFVNFDDDRYVTDNAHVRAGLHWSTVTWAFTTFDEANWGRTPVPTSSRRPELQVRPLSVERR